MPSRTKKRPTHQANESGTRSCPSCGHKVKSGSYCPACGHKIADAGPAPFSIGAYALIALIVIVFLALSIGLSGARPFVGANEDDNAVFGLGAMNQARLGVWALKFGIISRFVDSPRGLTGSFYTNHPQWFILPNTFFYKVFGVSEITTRLPGIIFSALSLLAFYFTVLLVYGDRKKALLAASVYALLPGLLFYSASFSEKIYVVAFSNFVILAFFLLQRYQSKYLMPLPLFLVFYGGLQGWHFYFAVVALWLYSLLNIDIKQRTFLLAALPAVAALSFALNFLHFYLLNGARFTSIFSQFSVRSARVPVALYIGRYSKWLGTNFTWPAVIAAALFLAYFLYLLGSKRRFGLPLVYAVQPLLVIIVFQQWSTHAFGPIYWAQFMALAMGLALDKLLQLADKRLLVAGIVVTGLFIGFSIMGVRTFTKPQIVSENDVQLLKSVSAQAPRAKVAIGNQFHLPFGYQPIVEWYLRRNLIGWEKGEADLVLTYSPNLGPAFNDQARKMVDSGYYQPVGRADVFWLLERKKEPRM